MPDLRSPRVWLAALWSLFQLWTSARGMFDLMIQLPLHVAFAVALGFLTPGASGGRTRWWDGIGALLALACGAHFVAWNRHLVTRMPMVDDPRAVDVWVSVLFGALLLESARRHVGGALVVLGLAFVVYAFAGPWMPGFLSHGGVTAVKFVDLQMLTTEGVFGIPTLVSASFIFLFVVFGAVMLHGGLLGFFTDLALAVAGSTRGGAAKVAVIASGLFGTVNGSAMANAVTTGAFTIPLMRRAGYRPEFAAGVEATASMGGQLIPPVMGAAAFIMAETLGMSYWDIAVAAAIPGVLYFVAVGVMVHLEAARTGLPVLDRSELPRLWPVLRRDLHLLAGPAVLVWLLSTGATAERAGFWALVVAVGASWMRASTRIGPRKMLTVLVDGAQGAMPVALACATVGIVVGVVSISGLGLKLATGIVGLAGGSLLVTCLLTMVAALILGTGLPTSATYIITSIMAAPALTQLGVPPLAAHMFVFYFGILADLTPPTAISTYATSAIAGSDVWRTQWTAMMLALSGFIIPFSFTYDPAMLLMNASVPHVALRTAAALLGIVMLGAGLIGYLRAPARAWERALLLAGACLLIFPGRVADLVGIACVVAVWLAQRGRAGAAVPAAAAR
ncbi:MAG TPA: TRAP transporter permease [Candidatus Tectomicrobia bacterium]|nr:TRAP transporter permease [Candidatus Tectomicrobia bacterium]